MLISRRLFAGGLTALTLPQPVFAQVNYPKKVKIMSGQSYGTGFDSKPWSFSTPARNVFRFEIRTGDQGYHGDPIGVRHRSEISASLKVPFNVPIWQSWSQLIEPGEPTRSGFVTCNQWHNAEYGPPRQPCVAFDYANEGLCLSEASGTHLLQDIYLEIRHMEVSMSGLTVILSLL